MLVDLILQ